MLETCVSVRHARSIEGRLGLDKVKEIEIRNSNRIDVCCLFSAVMVFKYHVRSYFYLV